MTTPATPKSHPDFSGWPWRDVYFGHWDVTFTEMATRVATPLGSICAWCDAPVKEGDFGTLIPVVTGGHVKREAWHGECLVRSSVGSVAHQSGRCPCSGVGAPLQNEQEGGRQDAIDAWRYLYRRHVGEGFRG